MPMANCECMSIELYTHVTALRAEDKPHPTRRTGSLARTLASALLHMFALPGHQPRAKTTNKQE
jgi:hypothetical protein